jgi:hypothetical protein
MQVEIESTKGEGPQLGKRECRWNRRKREIKKRRRRKMKISESRRNKMWNS